MKSFEITKNDANQRLDRFILKVCPTMPQALMYKYIRLKRIKVNGKRGEISTRLDAGDRVDAYINDEFFADAAPKYDFLSSPARLNIVYRTKIFCLPTKSRGLLFTPTKTNTVTRS